VKIQGQYLEIGRPKNATGPIPKPSELLCGNPNFNAGSTAGGSTAGIKKKNSTTVLVQQALTAGKRMLNPTAYPDQENQIDLQALNQPDCTIAVENFPKTHTDSMITEICNVFGQVKHVELQNDPLTGKFTGDILVLYSTPNDAKKALSGMTGLKVEDSILLTKKQGNMVIGAMGGATEGGEEEVFQALIEDRPTPVLCLKNVVDLAEIGSRMDYKELEFDVKEEMQRYGSCVKVVAPRPPMFGDPHSMPGFGRVFVQFKVSEEAERAKKQLFRRRFNGRSVDVNFFPEDKF